MSGSLTEDKLSRVERKVLTRNGLMQAALRLIGSGRSFTSLAIREITREAQMVPNAFYRHFDNTDALGLALVEEVGITLRRLLRQARQSGLAQQDLVRTSVQIYVDYVRQNRLHFLFICSERAGGSKLLRQAIGNEIAHFTHEMAQDFRALAVYQNLSGARLANVCSLIVTAMLAVAPEILDLPARQILLEQEMIDNFVRQLQIVLLGAAHWRERGA